MAAILDPKIADDRYNFVIFNWPWGKAGTPLEHSDGPKKWQKAEMDAMSDHTRENRERIRQGQEPLMWRSATCSGRGIGKSAKVSWDIYYSMSCIIGGTVIVTANTEPQLKSRTWAELGKWHDLALNSHWFERSALTLKPAKWFGNIVTKQLGISCGYYYAQAQLWSEDLPDSFAGAHNPLGMSVLYDEASSIPQSISTVTSGFFTEPVLHRYWQQYSNGRRNTGAFFECFHKNRDRWTHTNIDSRDVEGTDKKVLQDIIDAHGEDSDEARVEVKGQFPRQSEMQFISREVVTQSQERELSSDYGAPLIMGVDVSRKGRHKSVIRWRRGRDARTIPPLEVSGQDNMSFAYTVAHWIDKTQPDAVCIDSGNGTGVIDRLRELKYKIHEVAFNSASTRRDCYNKRASMWADMRDWLDIGCIDRMQHLEDDLVGPMYDWAGTDGDKYILEPKESLEKRGLASTDHGDALALTFAVKVAAKAIGAQFNVRASVARDVDYDVIT